MRPAGLVSMSRDTLELGAGMLRMNTAASDEADLEMQIQAALFSCMYVCMQVCLLSLSSPSFMRFLWTGKDGTCSSASGPAS